MTRLGASRQRGIALLALLAVIMLVASWFLVSRLNAESGGRSAVNRAHNAEVLNRARIALIGYVVSHAAEGGADGEKYPGRFPCPEAVNNIGTDSEGIAAPMVTPSTPTCSSIGRLPWRTLGLEKLIDAAGEPLWFVVGPAWRLTTSSSTLVINSNTAGDTTVDGQAVIALIIAPGAAMNAAAATGCTARNQARSTPSPSIDAADYLECFDASTLTFTTTASSSAYNDQVVRITVADIMPAIEAVVANRIEREILPALQTVFTPATWGFTGSNPVLPFAAPFANPGPGAGTSGYQGASGTYAGLLPFNNLRLPSDLTQSCTESATDLRCTTVTTGTSATTGLPAFLVFSKAAADIQTAGGGSIRTQSSCSWASTTYICIGEYLDPMIAVTVSVTVSNVAMGLRTLDTSKIVCTAVDDAGLGDAEKTIACSVATTLNSDGSVTFTVATDLLPDVSDSGWNTYANYKVKFDRAVFGDHALLDPSDATTGWFVQNEWYRLAYYVVSQGNTAAQLPAERSCGTAGNCFTVANPSTAQSAALILAGRSLNGVARPSGTLTDYLEFGNAGASYERQTATREDALIYSDTGTANAYNVAVSSLATGASFQFKASNANTGTSTLNTTATGTRSLVNLDGSNLDAGAVRANSAVQVKWDGTQFMLVKRPFNDRFAVLGSN